LLAEPLLALELHREYLGVLVALEEPWRCPVMECLEVERLVQSDGRFVQQLRDLA